MRSTTHQAPVTSDDADVAPLRVALGEYDPGWEDPDRSLARAGRLVADAAAAGARLVVLPEMCASGFTMDADRWAEPIDGPSASRLSRLAAAHGVWLLAGLALRDAAGAHNAALLLAPSGDVAGRYRKQRLFTHGGEHAHYVPGRDAVVLRVDGVRVAPLVCYDLRFPELFRPLARDVDAYLLIANWPAARRAHWDALVRARAIENLAYVVAVNRTGEGGGATYDGGSVAIDPWGRTVAATEPHRSAPVVASIDARAVRDVRARYRFLDDYDGAAGAIDGMTG